MAWFSDLLRSKKLEEVALDLTVLQISVFNASEKKMFFSKDMKRNCQTK